VNKFSIGDDRLAAWALAALILGGISIAASPIMVRLSETGPVASAFWRVMLALPFFWAALRRESRKAPDSASTTRLSGKLKRDLFVCGLLFATDLAFWHWAIGATTVANATLLSNLMTIVVAIGAWLLFGERLNRVFFVGMVLALLGAGQLAGASFSANPDQLAGDGLGLVTALFYGGYMLSVRYLRGQNSTMTIMFYSGVASAVLLLPLAFFMGEVVVPPTAYGWLVLAGLAFFSQLMGQSLITFGFKHLPSAFGALTLLIQPVVAAAIAWPLFNEPLAAPQFIGAALILSGIIIARLASR
jgi:drug/metabolite transporter (DMT)-like permease